MSVGTSGECYDGKNEALQAGHVATKRICPEPRRRAGKEPNVTRGAVYDRNLIHVNIFLHLSWFHTIFEEEARVTLSASLVHRPRKRKFITQPVFVPRICHHALRTTRGVSL
ncbi:hypothetical protein R1flu_007089 [Riccia fluitans]|uniref:Uncharacterized protein n=1 Tax=Riccia fluitans TaxID=41844 RepID=A0ABD1YY55_9MARC